MYTVPGYRHRRLADRGKLEYYRIGVERLPTPALQLEPHFLTASSQNIDLFWQHSNATLKP